MRRSHFITAISLNPLPKGPELRSIVDAFLQRQRKPGDILRAMADHLDAVEDRRNLPARFKAHKEADTLLDDYKDRAYRLNYRCTPEHAAKLAALSFATGLDQTALIRLALFEAQTNEPRLL